MQGSLAECLYCHSKDLQVNRVNQTVYCRECLRVIEERHSDVRETLLLTEHDSPLCVVTSDLLQRYKFEDGEIPDDPFVSQSFITAFSPIRVQRNVAFGVTARTFPGHLAELERLVGDSLYGTPAKDGPTADAPSQSSQTNRGTLEDHTDLESRQDPETLEFSLPLPSSSGQLSASQDDVLLSLSNTNGGDDDKVANSSGEALAAAASADARNILIAYFQITELCDHLNLEKEAVEQALQMFRTCAQQTPLRNRNIEALATAALVTTLRRMGEPRTLQEMAITSSIPQKEIARHLKLLNHSQEPTPPTANTSISAHMPRFCASLGLNERTQDLAKHIAEVVVTQNFCNRRNPVSISAAAIYLACQLEDYKKTQTEVCKATALTEVTLRKVYKELAQHLDILLPQGYTPIVPPDKAFPSTLITFPNQKAHLKSEGQGQGHGQGQGQHNSPSTSSHAGDSHRSTPQPPQQVSSSSNPTSQSGASSAQTRSPLSLPMPHALPFPPNFPPFFNPYGLPMPPSSSSSSSSSAPSTNSSSKPPGPPLGWPPFLPPFFHLPPHMSMPSPSPAANPPSSAPAPAPASSSAPINSSSTANPVAPPPSSSSNPVPGSATDPPPERKGSSPLPPPFLGNAFPGFPNFMPFPPWLVAFPPTLRPPSASPQPAQSSSSATSTITPIPSSAPAPTSAPIPVHSPTPTPSTPSHPMRTGASSLKNGESS